MLNEHVIAAIVVLLFLQWSWTALIYRELRRLSKYHKDSRDTTNND